ncbi:Transposon Ty3-I Gag-Pol polyprotein, partial [Nosema granulosis]
MFCSNNLATADKIFFVFRNEEKDDPQQFLEDLMEMGRLNEYSEGKLLLIFKMSLKKEAKDWITAQPVGLSLNELLERFRERFISNMLLKVNLEKLAGLKYTEGSILNYLDRMAGLAREGNVPEQVLIAFVLNGLPNNVTNSVLINNKEGLTWEYIYTSLRNIKMMNCEINQSTPLSCESIEISAVRTNTRGKSKKQSKIRCFIRNQQGHVVSQCRFNSFRNSSNKFRQVNEISKSHAEGDNNGGNYDDLNKFIFNYGVLSKDKDKSTVKTAILVDSNKRVNVLLDSGADINLIRPEVLPRKSVLAREKRRLLAANHSTINVIGLIRLKLKIEGYVFEDDFVVTRDIGIPCIIGHTLLDKYKICLQFGNGKVDIESKEILKGNSIGYHRIDTGDSKPIMTQLYKLGGINEEAASKIIKNYIDQGIIRPSESAWRSPIIVVPKKDGDNRLCVDYRRLNDVTVKDAYPMPRVDEFINALEGAVYFTKLDADSGYHQIDMCPQDIEKTAFACREGLFEFTKMPFGL